MTKVSANAMARFAVIAAIVRKAAVVAVKINSQKDLSHIPP